MRRLRLLLAVMPPRWRPYVIAAVAVAAVGLAVFQPEALDRLLGLAATPEVLEETTQ